MFWLGIAAKKQQLNSIVRESEGDVDTKTPNLVFKK
jgi:hypothetical protein